MTWCFVSWFISITTASLLCQNTSCSQSAHFPSSFFLPSIELLTWNQFKDWFLGVVHNSFSSDPVWWSWRRTVMSQKTVSAPLGRDHACLDLDAGVYPQNVFDCHVSFLLLSHLYSIKWLKIVWSWHLNKTHALLLTDLSPLVRPNVPQSCAPPWAKHSCAVRHPSSLGLLRQCCNQLIHNC